METYKIITDLPSLDRLRDSWETLWASSSARTVFNTFAWTKATLDMHQLRGDGKLFCLVMLRDGHASLIWPFLIFRHHRWRMAIPVGTDQGSYSDVLAEDHDADHQLRRAWRIVRTEIAADLINLPGVREPSPLYRLLRDVAQARVLSCEAAPYLRSRDFASWDEYYRSRDPSLRKRLENCTRRLIKQEGPVHVEVADSVDRALALTNWLLDHKRNWLTKSHLENETVMLAPDYRQFLYDVVQELYPDGRCLVQVLRTDSHILAVCLIFRCGWRSELFQAGYDQKFAKFSPGTLARLHMVEREFRLGQEIDMLNGEAPSKHVWTDDVKVTMFHYRCDASAFGKVYWLVRFMRTQIDRYRQRQ